MLDGAQEHYHGPKAIISGLLEPKVGGCSILGVKPRRDRRRCGQNPALLVETAGEPGFPPWAWLGRLKPIPSVVGDRGDSKKAP